MSNKYMAYKPEKMNKAAWEAIVSAWEDGLSDREAAFRASRAGETLIRESDIKELVKEVKEIADLRDYLQSDVVSMAKGNIAKSIRDGNISTSKWLLERKAANEYSTKQAGAFEGAVIAVQMQEKQAEFEKLIEELGGELKEDDSDAPWEA